MAMMNNMDAENSMSAEGMTAVEGCPGGQDRLDNIKLTAVRIPASARPIRFDEDSCLGCNRCMNICQVDIFIPNPEKGRPPIVLYPGECYYCGSCVMVCPVKGAITLSHPLMNQAKFVPVRQPEDDASC